MLLVWYITDYVDYWVGAEMIFYVVKATIRYMMSVSLDMLIINNSFGLR